MVFTPQPLFDAIDDIKAKINTNDKRKQEIGNRKQEVPVIYLSPREKD